MNELRSISASFIECLEKPYFYLTKNRRRSKLAKLNIAFLIENIVPSTRASEHSDCEGSDDGTLLAAPIRQNYHGHDRCDTLSSKFLEHSGFEQPERNPVRSGLWPWHLLMVNKRISGSIVLDAKMCQWQLSRRASRDNTWHFERPAHALHPTLP
mmetsp:Transcript_9353/g.15115  ORF Transcript_9353/g.15115 Transcript_9353/m.15115 type:complete len:155 (-) Transcript_9353:239-703(-)